MKDSLFDARTRAFADSPSRRAVLGGGIAMAVVALSRTPAAVRAKGADPQNPWNSDWCTLVDGVTPGWLMLFGLDQPGFYGNEVGCGKVKDCVTFDDGKKLNCTWVQTTDRTKGKLTIELKDHRTRFEGKYKITKGGEGKGEYTGDFKNSQTFRRSKCCTNCCETGPLPTGD